MKWDFFFNINVCLFYILKNFSSFKMKIEAFLGRDDGF